jgi:predicted Zn-dependent protease
MQEWANLALETARARGASFADARVMDIRQRDLSTKNGQVGNLSESESLGLGIRVMALGCWGFASTDPITFNRMGLALAALALIWSVCMPLLMALASRMDGMTTTARPDFILDDCKVSGRV